MPEYPKCPTQTVVDPTSVVYEDYYHPQVVEVIHNVEIVRRHHCVPIPKHCYNYTVRDEMCGVSNLRNRRGR
ncbi:hypothetical protein B9T62_15920 [Paenibacillus donghaensis]|uniref:Spore coat protein D n=1 Tax=Paenibacillus donghaensis TaxID=414771 RepID=A0A2Z2K722_9BACL|nr:hypothetical protein B9T62_15920 [Paenibacillus donghaensis]